jgi:hypothetical protein
MVQVRERDTRTATADAPEVVIREDGPIPLAPPKMRDGHFACPRCVAKLLFDGEKLSCLMCGYEHAAPPRQRGGPRNAGEMLDALPVLRSELIGHVDALGQEPAPGSRGSHELERLEGAAADGVHFARLFAYQSVLSAGHSIIALARGLEPPAPEYGTWGIAHTVLEAAGTVGWLLDTRIDGHERARRGLALQARDLEAECEVLSGLISARRGASDLFEDALVENRRRRSEVAEATVAVGGAADIPDAAELAKSLGAELEYQMFSAVANGRPWALRHATSVQGNKDADWAGSILIAQVHSAATWYARAAWTYARWMSSGPLDELRSVLEFGYDSLLLPNDHRARFWRREGSRARTAALAS